MLWSDKIMRFIRVVSVFILIFAAQIGNVNAEPFEEKVLKVGYMPNTGFITENWEGHYTGYGYEYMEFLANYGHWKFEYVPANTWLELGEKLNSGEIDIMPCMPGDYHLIPNSVRTDHVVGRFPMELVTKYKDIKPHMQLGVVSTSYPVTMLPEIAENENFSYELISFPNFNDMIESFNRDELDGYVDAMLNINGYKNVIALFDRQSYRLLVRSSDKELLSQLNYAMDKMLLNQPNIRNRLNKKYIKYEGFPLILSRQEREYLQEKRKLKTTYINDRKPYFYFDKNGTAKGAIPEILKRVSEDLNIEIEIVKSNSPTESRQLISEGKVDFVVDAVCDYGQASLYNIKPTQPYFALEYAPVRRKDYDGHNPIVACVAELIYTKSYIEQRYSKDKIMYFSTLEECFEAVNDGRADILFVPRSEVPYYIEETDTYNLETTSKSYFEDEISFGVYAYSDPRLWQILNNEINHLSEQFIRNTVNMNMKSEFHLTPKWFIYHHPIKIVILVIIIGTIIIGAIWYRNRMRRKHIEIIQKMAYTDARYNLPNLAWLESEVPQYLIQQRMDHSNKTIYVAVLAMESKAAIVEQYGEELLKKHMCDMSAKLNEKDWVSMTAAGIDAGHLICICKADNESQIAEYLSESLSEYSFIETKDSRIWLHMKAGICELKANDFSVRQVVEKANIACYESSIHDVQIFDDKMQENLTLQHQIESHMEKALADGEFEAWYQPKYDIKTRRIIGAEALVRWTSLELGFMPPGKFIPLFEKNGFVIPVDYEILEQVFQLQKKRLAEGKEVVPISVNQSRLHMTEEGYLDKIKAIIDKYDLSPTGLIELEVTETVFGDFDQKSNQKRAANIIGKLHEMGFTISVDDFGSGYSSFMMLNYLPMDVMKIDRSLLETSGDSKRMRDILANVIKLGRSLNMQVICEGIETKEQEDLLLELGCHCGQGYLNAKPMPLNDFIKFFEKRNSEVA